MRKLGRVRTKTESPKFVLSWNAQVGTRQDENRTEGSSGQPRTPKNVPNVGASLASTRMAMLVEKMGRKRQLEGDMYQALAGASKTLQLTHFTKDMLIATHTTEDGGFEGMLIFNEKQDTFSADTTTLYRLIMQYAQVPNVWNYGVTGQVPFVLDKQKGPALPLFKGVTIETVLMKLKAAAENQTPHGLKMERLDFIVTPGDETLTMRDATAKCIYEKHGVAVPESLAHVVVTNQVVPGLGGGVPNHFSASQSPASSPNRWSPASSNAGRLGASHMQAEIAEGLAIVRGIKRSMQARHMWVEAEEQQNQCSQQ